MNKKNLFLNVLSMYGLALTPKVTRANEKFVNNSDQHNQSEIIIDIQTCNLCEDNEWNVGCSKCKE